MNDKALDPNLSKLEVVKAYWPNHSIETHIMSQNPIELMDIQLEIVSLGDPLTNRPKSADPALAG